MRHLHSRPGSFCLTLALAMASPQIQFHLPLSGPITASTHLPALSSLSACLGLLPNLQQSWRCSGPLPPSHSVRVPLLCELGKWIEPQ